MAVDYKATSQVILPRASIARISLSMPHAKRLQKCSSWVNLDRVQLEAEVRAVGWEVCGQRPGDFQREIDTLYKDLKTLGTAPVWLVPSAVGAKIPYVEHLRPLLSQTARSLVGFGLRDSFQNFGKFLFQRGQVPSLVCRACEPLATREYAALFCTTAAGGHLRGGQARFTPTGISATGISDEIEFAIVATPLVENGQLTPIDKRLSCQSDLRHEFRISPPAWKSDLPALQQLLFSNDPPEVIGQHILAEANRRGLQPETGYYLSSLGVRENGDLVLISQHSSVSEMAQAQLNAGSIWALLTEEGGSCATSIWQNAMDHSLPDHVKRDANGSAVWQPEPVTFGSNSYFRPSALAMGIVELNELFLEAPFVI